MRKLLKKKKKLRTIWISLCVLLLLIFTIVFYTLKFRVKDVLRQIVAAQTNHAYELALSDVDVSLLHKRIIIKNAALVCVEPGNNTYYNLQAPQVYFSFRSWSKLIFSNHIDIDQLQLVSPVLKIYQAGKEVTDKKISFETSSIFDLLQKLIAQLKIHSLNIENASVAFASATNAVEPFVINKINLVITEFRKKNNNGNHFLSAGDIDLHIGKQQWKLPVSNNELSFSQIKFSGKDQYFEIDSCHFSEAATEKKDVIDLSADKFLFSSNQLSSIYAKDELLLDTLICFRPVLFFKLKEKPTGKSNSHVLRNFMVTLFTNINIQHIAVNEGQIVVFNTRKNRNSLYSTEKTDLQIADLNVTPSGDKYFTVGSIDLRLNEVKFYSRDSLFLLKMGHFGFYNSDLLCKNVSFMPTGKNTASKGLNISVPGIALNDIDFEELLQKKLVAASANFDKPEIIINKEKRIKSKTRSANGFENFYDLLHGLSQLILVDTVNIHDGTVFFKSPSSVTYAKHVNAAVLLKNFLLSSSLINIMNAIPSLQADEIKLSSPGLHSELTQVNIHGISGKNSIGNFIVDVPNRLQATGTNLLWHKADWDLFYKTGKLRASEWSIEKLSVAGKQKIFTGGKQNLQNPANALANISTGKFTIGQLNFDYAFQNVSRLKFSGKNITFANLTSNKNFVTWQNANGTLNNILYEAALQNVKISKINFSSNKETTFEQLAYRSINGNSIIIPSAQLKTFINSTDFSQLNFTRLFINNPVIHIQSIAKEKGSNAKVAMPLALYANEVKINKGVLNYSSLNDSIKMKATVDLAIDSLFANTISERKAGYRKATLQMSTVTFENKKISANIPKVTMQSSEGNISTTEEGKFSLLNNITTQWFGVNIYPKDSVKSTLTINNFSGKAALPKVEIANGKKINVPQLVNNLNITDGDLHYKDSLISLTANNLQWNGDQSNLSVQSFKYKPNISRSDFFKNSIWQSDYITSSCEKIVAEGFDIDKWITDSSVKIHKVILYNPSVTSSRDKQIPFHHGLEKLMPTKLLHTIKQPFYIDSIFLNNGAITVNEISDVTGREGSIPFSNVSATVSKLSNETATGDSLSLKASGRFLDCYIREIFYRESYPDSLSGFVMGARISAVDLTALSAITNPLAAVRIIKGYADTLYESIAGNKYGALGEMKFYYKHLKIRIFNSKDTAKKNLMLSFKNLLANKLIVKDFNRKKSRIFFMRDPEKFIFNYWVKITFSGVLTSAGIKRNKKYYKKFLKLKQYYSLPAKYN